MTQIFTVNSNLTAKLVANLLCDSKTKRQVVSIANDTAIKDFYKMLSSKKSKVCSSYTLKTFVELVKSLKEYIENNPTKIETIIDQLNKNNIELINFSDEVRECHRLIQQSGIRFMEIEDINNVMLIDGKYIYIKDGDEYELGGDCMIVRPNDALSGSIIAYIGATHEELQRITNSTRPARGWYAMECGVNYFNTRDITVKYWYELDDYHKQFTCL